jgi:malonyl CoA-acyl carrier protein transacylase
VGLEPARIEALLRQSDAARRLDVANFNSFDQTVIAGPREDIEALGPVFEAAGVRAYIPLNVSAPFHSRYMRAPMEEFAAMIGRVSFGPLAFSVMANVTGRPYDPAAIGETLGRQIGHSVRWLDSMLFLLDAGVTDFEEVGPGGVLRKLVAQIRKKRG